MMQLNALLLARALVLAPFLLAGCGRVGVEGKADSPPAVVQTASGVEMVRVPGGWFRMGSEGNSADESPVHRVWIDAFLMDRYEMRQDIYVRLAGSNPSSFKGDARPVDTVNWVDAALFCNLRSRAEGLEPCYAEVDDQWRCNFEATGYRLPTEAEWEYACRAGTTTGYSFGSDERSLASSAWFRRNSNKSTREVGKKRPNPWGFHDLHGNVSEWCNDVYSTSYYQRGPERNPPGPELGEVRVVRGGGWNSSAAQCRSASRTGENQAVVDSCITDSIGFRCVRRPD